MSEVINVTNGSQAKLTLANSYIECIPGATNGLDVPLVQDITLTTTPGTVRYSTLDSTASAAFTTVTENSVALNVLVDGDSFFGNVALTENSVALNGLFSTSNTKEEIFWSVAFEGTDSGSRYIWGQGYIGGLAPSASLEQAVWITPMEIIVNGDITQAVVPV